MRTTVLACVAAVLAFCGSHVSGFSVQRALKASQVSSTSLQVKREPIKMPSQTPMFPYKVRSCLAFLWVMVFPDGGVLRQFKSLKRF